MLAGQDLGAGVQPFQAHRALEQIQQGRFVHPGACAVPRSLQIASQMRQVHFACACVCMRELGRVCRGSPQPSCHSHATSIGALLPGTARRQTKGQKVYI